MKFSRGLKLFLSGVVVFVVVASLIFSNVIPISYLGHLTGTLNPISTNNATSPVSSNNTTRDISQNSTTSQNTTSNKTVVKPSSSLFGPVFVVNVKDYNFYYTSTLQLTATYFNSSGKFTQVLETTILENGQFNFTLPANKMLNVSKSYVDGGFGGSGSFTSLTLMVNKNSANPGAPYYNNVQFCPYTLYHSVTNMTVNGNLTYLDHHFSGTGVNPSRYSEISFVNYTLSTTIWG